MPALRLIGLCLLAASSTACAPDDISGVSETLAHAVATPACGPADGPAVAIYLTSAPAEVLEPPAPHVRITVWQPLESLAGRSWNLTDRTLAGGAWYHSTATDFELATSGRVTVNAVSSRKTIRGSVDLVFPKAGRVRREFEALWRSRATLCG